MYRHHIRYYTLQTLAAHLQMECHTRTPGMWDDGMVTYEYLGHLQKHSRYTACVSWGPEKQLV